MNPIPAEIRGGEEAGGRGGGKGEIFGPLAAILIEGLGDHLVVTVDIGSELKEAKKRQLEGNIPVSAIKCH